MHRRVKLDQNGNGPTVRYKMDTANSVPAGSSGPCRGDNRQYNNRIARCWKWVIGVGATEALSNRQRFARTEVREQRGEALRPIDPGVPDTDSERLAKMTIDRASRPLPCVCLPSDVEARVRQEAGACPVRDGQEPVRRPGLDEVRKKYL